MKFLYDSLFGPNHKKSTLTPSSTPTFAKSNTQSESKASQDENFTASDCFKMFEELDKSQYTTLSDEIVQSQPSKQENFDRNSLV